MNSPKMMESDFEDDGFDLFDMNREEFNPAMCMLRYSRECNLDTLVVKNKHIETEIESLDSDLRNLLYDNYKKIDKVSSVITNMMSDIGKMEEKFNDLDDRMNGISRTSSSILENLKPVENKMSKLLKMQDTIKKLSLLTDLVPNMKIRVNEGAHGAAARCYLKAEKLLKKYSHFQSLSGIVKDCSEVVAEIKEGLRDKLNCEIYKKEELTDNLQLLLALEETPEHLLEHFLICSEKCLESLLASISAKISSEKSQIQFLGKVNNYINLYCNYIERISIVLLVAKNVFSSLTNLKTDILFTMLEDFFLNNMRQLRMQMIHHMEETFQEVDDDIVSQVLDKFIRQCHKGGIINTRISFYNEGMDILLQICISRCENYLQTLKKDFDMKLVKEAGELSSESNFSNIVLNLIEWTKQKMISLLSSLVYYIRPEFRCCRELTFRKIFCKIVVRESTFIAFLKHVIEGSWKFLSSKNIVCFSKPLMCAIVAKYLMEFSVVIPKFFAKLNIILNSSSENLSLTPTETVTTEFKKIALKVIDLYIQIRSQIMTEMIQKSMDNRNWMISKEPTRPRAVIKMIVNDLRDAQQEIEKIFGKRQPPERKKSSDSGSSLYEMYFIDAKSKPNTIEEKVLLNKLFQEYSISSLKVELNTPSIINSLLLNTLNSFIQLIRLKTFNIFSLQQIQVDVFYMHYELSKFTYLEPVIQSLFDEIISSSCNRTVKPRLMSKQVVSVICNTVL